jgi:hypothetical protein
MNFLKFLRGKAMGTLAKLVLGTGKLNELVTLPLKGMADEVKTGAIWQGPGADTFVAVLMGEHVPASNVITGQIKSMHDHFQRSVQLIDDADARSKSQADAFGELCTKVF